jgi:hypothetical protein
MENKKKNIMSLRYLRSLILLTLIVFGFVTIIASGGSDSEKAPVETPTYSISGTITSGGEALASITVLLSGDATANTITGDDGSYTFSELEAGSYTVTPDKATGYTFVPVNAAVTISNANVTGKDFAATQVSATSYLHFTLPDQKTWFTGIGGIIASNGNAQAVTEDIVTAEAAALFTGYTLADGVVYTTNPDGSTASTVSGYALAQFVSEDDVITATPDPDGLLAEITEAGNDARELYSVINVSNNDGFDNRTKFMGTNGAYNADLRWDVFNTGYLLNIMYSGKTHFPGSVATPPTEPSVKMYNNKWSYDLYMFRKIDVKRPDTAGTLATFEVKATADSYVDETNYTLVNSLSTTKFNVTSISFANSAASIIYTNVKAISLDQFLTTYVVSDATNANYTFKIVGLDDNYLEGWSYANMQNAYYLPDYDFICRVDSATDTMVSGTKINFPVRIEVITSDAATISAADSYVYTSYGPPAYAIYDEDDNGAE